MRTVSRGSDGVEKTEVRVGRCMEYIVTKIMSNWVSKYVFGPKLDGRLFFSLISENLAPPFENF